MPSIRHVVVLMLENRSFDHMLGFLGIGDGLSGAEFNLADPADPSSAKVTVSKDAQYSGDFGDPPVDPSHEHAHVNVQLFNAAVVPSPVPTSTNIGFVKDYGSLEHQTPGAGEQIMKCFDPQKLPALSTLAREFVLCDRWFCLDRRGPTGSSCTRPRPADSSTTPSTISRCERSTTT
jgi:phospholipase C